MRSVARKAPDGRFPSGAWLVNDLAGDGVELSWKDADGSAGFCGWTVDMATADAFMRAVEAEDVPCAKDALAQAGFVREIPQGLSAGTPPLLLRDAGGEVTAWITSDYETTLNVPGEAGAGRPVASAVLPMDGRNQPCSLTRGRRIGDLTIAALLGCWRSRGDPHP